MKQALLILDMQQSFRVPPGIVKDVALLARRMPSLATVERHREDITPFRTQLGWAPASDDECLVPNVEVVFKYGYLPPPDVVQTFKDWRVDRVLVCGGQIETCVMAAGFALFDAGLRPTLLEWLSFGSSLSPSGELGIRLWRHHFGATIYRPEDLDRD